MVCACRYDLIRVNEQPAARRVGRDDDVVRERARAAALARRAARLEENGRLGVAVARLARVVRGDHGRERQRGDDVGAAEDEGVGLDEVAPVELRHGG